MRTIAEYEQLLKDRRTPAELETERLREEKWLANKLPDTSEVIVYLVLLVLFGLLMAVAVDMALALEGKP